MIRQFPWDLTWLFYILSDLGNFNINANHQCICTTLLYHFWCKNHCKKVQIKFCNKIYPIWFSKGQLISKAIYGLLNSYEKQTDEFDFPFYSSQQKKSNLSVHFLEEVSRTWIAFEINWYVFTNSKYQERQNMSKHYSRVPNHV